MSKAFTDCVILELETARKFHPTNIHNPHEGYAIIMEEMDEFWDEVKRKPGDVDKDAMYKELIQVAAMCMRTVEDCGL